MVAYLNKQAFKKLFPSLPKSLIEAEQSINVSGTESFTKKELDTSKLIMKCALESSESKAFWEWAQYHPIAKERLYHIPNGGSRHPLEAKNLKAQGAKPGISDYFLSYPHNGKHGLYIELKRASRSVSRLTVEQAAWLAASERLGYATKVAYGAAEAIKAIEEYLK